MILQYSTNYSKGHIFIFIRFMLEKKCDEEMDNIVVQYQIKMTVLGNYSRSVIHLRGLNQKRFHRKAYSSLRI